MTIPSRRFHGLSDRFALMTGVLLMFALAGAGSSAGLGAQATGSDLPFKPAFANQTRAPQPPARSTYVVETVASGLARPWSLAFLPDGRMLIAEKAGAMRIVDRQGKPSEPIAGVPSVRVVAAEGLHDVVLDPQFSTNRTLYFTYFAPPEGEAGGSFAQQTYVQWLMKSPEERVKSPVGHERVARAKLSADDKRLEDVKVILEGGDRRLVIARDGTLLVAASTPAGGGNVPIDDLPQRLNNLNGKVLRINRDGSVPRDNPYVGRAGARAELYTIGLRDPEGAALNPATGELWTVEHGVKGGDEVNVARRGANLGFPIISYGTKYSGEPIGEGLTAKEGLQQPVYFWNPDIAPSGMAFYTGNLFPQWKGNLFVGAMVDKNLVRLVLNGDRVEAEERLLTEIGQRIRDVRQGPDGALYVLTDEDNGRVLKLAPKR